MLNKLIEINNDRIEGYETASKETEEMELKTLFAQLAETSQNCKAELIDEVTQLGGEPVEGTKTSGKFFRAWMDVKSALTGKDRKAILILGVSMAKTLPSIPTKKCWKIIPRT